MNALFVSTIVLFTILMCLGLGVSCGYLAVTGILRAFGHKPSKDDVAALHAVHVGSGD